MYLLPWKSEKNGIFKLNHLKRNVHEELKKSVIIESDPVTKIKSTTLKFVTHLPYKFQVNFIYFSDNTDVKNSVRGSLFWSAESRHYTIDVKEIRLHLKREQNVNARHMNKEFPIWVEENGCDNNNNLQFLGVEYLNSESVCLSWFRVRDAIYLIEIPAIS